ncbi:MAG: AAA family ATPase, partial [Candidatus Bathyarchaeia archaeon]
MLLKRAYLENFISHARSELKFDYGINVIRGPNGAGKTSILDAISFGLFNIHSRGKKENLINNRADKAHIAIEFSEGGVNYIVEWIVDRKKPAAGILSRIQDGEKIIIAKGGERVIIPEIEKILSFDKDLFINSIYIKQGEIERLITETSAVRKEIITKLLGIEDLERAYQNMKEVINEYQAIVERLVGELKRKPEVEDQIQSLKSEIESLSLLLKSKKLKLKSIEEEIKILEEMLKELELKKERFIELSSQKAVLEATIENLDKTLRRKKDELKEAESAFTKVEILKEFVVKLPLIESYIDLFRKLNEKEKDIGQEYQKLKRVESLRSILVQNEGAYKSYLEKIALLKQKREERKSYEGAKEELAQVKKHLQDNVKKRNKKFEILLQRLNEYSQILGREVTQENIELILKAKKNELEILKAKLEKEAYSLREEIGGIKKEIEEIELKISKIADAKVCPVCGRDLTLEHKAILQEEFERTKQESQERINKLQEELKNVDLEKKECEKNL